MSRPYIGAALLFLGWILPGLFGHDPWKADEAYSLGLVCELPHGGSWVVSPRHRLARDVRSTRTHDRVDRFDLYRNIR